MKNVRGKSADRMHSDYASGRISREELFNGLYDSLGPRLESFCYRFLRDREEAADVVQETFCKAFERLDSYKEIAQFSTWLFTIAGNYCKSELRRRKRWKMLYMRTSDGEKDSIDVEYDGPSPDSVTEDDEIHRAVGEAVEHADIWSGYMEAFAYRFMEDMSYEEIASRMGIPVGSVKSGVFRARNAVKRRLHHLAEDYGIAVDS